MGTKAERWTRDDLPRPDAIRFVTDDVALDLVVDHLNAHHPKPQPYDQGGVRGADSLLYRAERAERERDAAAARAEQAEDQWKKWERKADQRGELLIRTEAERDAAAARAEQAGARVRLANQQSVEWEGEAERLLCERDAWKARAEAAEARTAPAVTRDDIEKAIRYEFLDWEGQMEARISRAVNQTWNLVSGADPAVHVVRESDLPAARVDGDYYVVASAKGDYKWPQHGPSWWAGRAQDALAKAARYTALARLAASEAVVDPVLDKAQEFAALADWELTDREAGLLHTVAAHVLGGQNDV